MKMKMFHIKRKNFEILLAKLEINTTTLKLYGSKFIGNFTVFQILLQLHSHASIKFWFHSPSGACFSFCKLAMCSIVLDCCSVYQSITFKYLVVINKNVYQSI